MQYRLMVEVEYLIALGKEKQIKELQSFSEKQKINLRKLYKNFNDEDATKIKKIEKKPKEVKIWFKIPNKLKKYVVKKGSIALDGISLTVVDVKFNVLYAIVYFSYIANTIITTQHE